jgi:hypothetical protein
MSQQVIVWERAGPAVINNHFRVDISILASSLDASVPCQAVREAIFRKDQVE